MTKQKWTADDIPDLSGKIIVVTGANSGIGFEAVRAFARNGAQVVMACRNLDKAQSAFTDLKRSVPQAQAEIMALDLASLQSVRDFVDAFKAKYDRLDILINNAGIMMTPYGTTEDGFERQFGTNHLGHFALVGLLIDLIRRSPGARVVNVSSIGHRSGEIDFDNVMYENGGGYSPMKAYGRSKLANLLFTYELQRRLVANQVDAIAVAAHPGLSNTSLLDHLIDKYYVGFLKPVMNLFVQSAEMGALPTLRAAVDPNAENGDYYGPDGRQEQKGYPVVVQSSRASHDRDDASRLWHLSQQLTGVEYLPLGVREPAPA